VFDPCQPLAVIAEPTATAAERQSVHDAIMMWNAAAGTHLTADPATSPALSIQFPTSGADFFYGVYDYQVPRVLVNHTIDDDAERKIVIAHELGHVFGLIHVSSSDRESVMNSPNLTVPVNAGDAGDLAARWGRCP